MKKQFVACSLFLALSLSAGAQTMGPCGPCGPGGGSSPGFNPGAPMLGPGQSGPGSDRNAGPQARFRSDDDVFDYIRQNYGGNANQARQDPRVTSWMKGLEGEARYVFQDRLDRAHDFSGDPTLTRITGTATNDYYCHDFAWRQGDKSPPAGGHINPDPILADPARYGYEVVSASSAQAGDIVVYHQSDGGKADHSGLVVRVQDGNTYMISKDVGNSLFRHQLDSPPGSPNFFRGAYGSEGVTILRPGPYAVKPTAGSEAPPPAASGP
ncbi:MAG: hypothetical protein AB7S38_30590 [Vulcanimicrobiota bacterium]